MDMLREILTQDINVGGARSMLAFFVGILNFLRVACSKFFQFIRCLFDLCAARTPAYKPDIAEKGEVDLEAGLETTLDELQQLTPQEALEVLSVLGETRTQGQAVWCYLRLDKDLQRDILESLAPERVPEAFTFSLHRLQERVAPTLLTDDDSSESSDDEKLNKRIWKAIADGIHGRRQLPISFWNAVTPAIREGWKSLVCGANIIFEE